MAAVSDCFTVGSTVALKTAFKQDIMGELVAKKTTTTRRLSLRRLGRRAAKNFPSHAKVYASSFFAGEVLAFDQQTLMLILSILFKKKKKKNAVIKNEGLWDASSSVAWPRVGDVRGAFFRFTAFSFPLSLFSLTPKCV